MALPHVPCFQVKWALVHDKRINKCKVYGICTDRRKVVVFIEGDSIWTEIDVPKISGHNEYFVLSEPLSINKEIHWLSTEAVEVPENPNNPQVLYCVLSVHVESGEVTRTGVQPTHDILKAVVTNPKERHHILIEEDQSPYMAIVLDNIILFFVLRDRVKGLWSLNDHVYLQLWSPWVPKIFLESFLSTELCIVQGKDFYKKTRMTFGMRILLHYGDELWVCNFRSLCWHKRGHLSREHKLCKLGVVHPNGLARLF